MKRNTLLVIALAVVGVLFFVNPFRLFRKGEVTSKRPEVPTEVLSPLVAWAIPHMFPPADYVVRAFKTHDIVFLGEFSKISQNVRLAGELIPRLYAAGVRNLGIEYALAEDQQRIDTLLTAPAWDEQAAREITFRWVVTWGFQEYVELYHAAWQVNHGRPSGAPPFRIVALNVRQNWQYVKTEADMTNAETVKKIMANGVPDELMARVISREVLARGEKALVYSTLQHAFTRYRSTEYEKNAADRGFTETRRMGNIIAAGIGSRAQTILLHAPWPDRGTASGMAYPVEGMLDALIDALPPDRRSGGFDTEGSPLGALPVRTGVMAAGHPGLTLAGVCDGYILQGPLSAYTTVTPIEGFIPHGQEGYATANFPGPKPDGLTAAQIEQAITDDLKAVTAALGQLK
jgi:hypothetical protein